MQISAGTIVSFVLGGLIALTWPEPAEALPFVGAQVRTLAFGTCNVGSDSEDVAEPFNASAGAGVAGTQTDCGFPQVFELALAEGTASLFTGHLTALAATDSILFAGASARSDISDVITIHGPTPAFSTTAGIRLRVEGTTDGASGGAQGYISLDPNGLLFGTPSVFRCETSGAISQGCLVRHPVGDFVFDLLFNVPVSNSNPSFPVTVGIYAEAHQTSFGDIRGSGQLSIELAPGFTFTSLSNALLTGAPAPVPEPSTLLLFGAGLAGLYAPRRRPRAPAGAAQ
jgi:hypothetical protein